ncbi:MAG: PilZ domain-containing protein [Gemmataceae bacterium]|nr:PilZ domain-containing protein [Gemmataceae bacterium]MCI0742212.1 PilZ domain-containing protein [Gemmataceae bacterium]
MADDQPILSEQPSVSLERDRRAYLRIPSDLSATCHDAPRVREPAWSGRVHDISQGGIGLVLQHRFGPGTDLLVDLRETAGAMLRTVRVRVVHATPILDDGSPCWLLGCVFDHPLDEAEFASLR